MKKTLQDLTIKDPFMLFEKMIQDEREAGRAAGRLEGEEAAFDRLNQLVQLLAEDDIVKVANDREYQKQLLKEFNL